MNNGIVVAAGLFDLGVLIGIVELWFAPWSVELFFKLEMTIGALFAIVLVVWFVTKENAENLANKRGDRLDDV